MCSSILGNRDPTHGAQSQKQSDLTLLLFLLDRPIWWAPYKPIFLRHSLEVENLYNHFGIVSD
uniref:Uncharacterized protein n=1 Tax=Rhizophagus irregularis (strain DAOM 181602 / DAOM 197198 / MUCL 43194) TaxID=747089 RepID=U9TM22_RHIID